MGREEIKHQISKSAGRFPTCVTTCEKAEAMTATDLHDRRSNGIFSQLCVQRATGTECFLKQ